MWGMIPIAGIPFPKQKQSLDILSEMLTHPEMGVCFKHNPFFFITHYGSFCHDFDFRAGLTVDPVAQMRKLKLRLSDLSQITWCS